MSSTAQELVAKLVQENNFQSTQEVLACLKGLFGSTIEKVMEAELDVSLGYEKNRQRANAGSDSKRNYRNGTSARTLKTELGAVDINVPRDRNGQYEPKIFDKYQRNADGIEEKIIALYGSGMSTRDIETQIRNLYDINISPELVSKITDKVMPEVNEWQNRPLDETYPFIFLDAIHYKVREDHQIITKAAYVVLGINEAGQKEVLGIWVGGNESSKYWLGVLNELKSRGVKNVYLFIVDGLVGFQEAIVMVYPRAQVQRCIIHQIRSSTKFVSYKHIKEFTKDLKRIYGATTEELALQEYEVFHSKWAKMYPSGVKSWYDNWDMLTAFFHYPVEIRKAIYTTNAIEALHRQLRKATKTKNFFPTEDSLRKILYLVVTNLSERWTMRLKDWDKVSNQLALMYEQRTAA